MKTTTTFAFFLLFLLSCGKDKNKTSTNTVVNEKTVTIEKYCQIKNSIGKDKSGNITGTIDYYYTGVKLDSAVSKNLVSGKWAYSRTYYVYESSTRRKLIDPSNPNPSFVTYQEINNNGQVVRTEYYNNGVLTSTNESTYTCN